MNNFFARILNSSNSYNKSISLYLVNEIYLSFHNSVKSSIFWSRITVNFGINLSFLTLTKNLKKYVHKM